MKKLKKPKRVKVFISKEKQKEIFIYFSNNSDNRISVIAEKFGINKYHLNKIIDLYLDNQKAFKERKNKK